MWDKETTAEKTGGNSVSYLRVTPHQDGVDGFFAAMLNNEAPEYRTDKLVEE